ncbi:MAG TPA: acyl-CoA synthetase [Acidimicrobiia bacterium]|nr:acyl-CoA synthetase [Acidimicrobiia bacterium]
MPDWNLADVYESIADVVPDRPALIAGGSSSRSWREFDLRASRLAAGLVDLGLEPDAKVALYLYNCPEYLESSFATFKMRGVHVNVNYRYLEDELAYLLDNSDAEIILFHGVLGEHVAAVRDSCPKLRAIVQVDDGSPLTAGALRYEDIIEQHEPMERIPRSGDDRWFLYTGGTTGMPKGVMWRHEDLFGTLAEAVYPILGGEIPAESSGAGAAALEFVAAGRSPVHLPASPLMHGTGGMTSMQTLFAGGTIVTLESRHFDPDELWRVVAEQQVTQMAIVGDAFCKPMVRALDEAAERGEPYDLSSLVLVISSGVMWSAPVKQALMAHKPLLCLDSLGSSEGVGFATNLTAPGQEASTAKFTIGARTRVLTEDGREVEPGSGERGMLSLGGHLPSGYYKDEEKSAGTFKVFDGVRYSVPGDWATVEADGTISLLGRGSVCINSGGEKIYPEEVEEALKALDGVRDCLVVGVPDERFGEAVTAVVAGEADLVLDPAHLGDSIDHLARFKHPRHIVRVETIPRGPNGKADYKWARATAVEQVHQS